MRGMLPADATWGVCGIGRAQLPMNLVALASGGHVRTGLEDNVMYHRGQLAETNRQLVERVARHRARDRASRRHARRGAGDPAGASLRRRGGDRAAVAAALGSGAAAASGGQMSR